MASVAGKKPTPLTPEIRQWDRCDRCCAPAQVAYVMGFGVILMCGHHADYHHIGLLLSGFSIDRDIREWKRST